jgi:hypothetical protein
MIPHRGRRKRRGEVEPACGAADAAMPLLAEGQGSEPRAREVPQLVGFVAGCPGEAHGSVATAMSDEDWLELPATKIAGLSDEQERQRLKALARIRQRHRRRRILRIDYYPTRKVTKIILRELNEIGGSASYTSVLDSIIEQWADASGIK